MAPATGSRALNIPVITLRYSPSLGGFLEEPLRQALAAGNVMEQREYFLVHGRVPHVLREALISEGRGANQPSSCRMVAARPKPACCTWIGRFGWIRGRTPSRSSPGIQIQFGTENARFDRFSPSYLQ